MFNSTSIDTNNNKGIKCDERKQHGAWKRIVLGRFVVENIKLLLKLMMNREKERKEDERERALAEVDMKKCLRSII